MTLPVATGDGGGGSLSYNQIPSDPTALGVGAATSSSTKNPNDVWSLGSLYGQPIALGMKNAPAPAKIDPTTGRPLTGSVTQVLDLGHSTQDIFTGVNRLWALQSEERKKDPHGLTSYEQFQQMLWQAGYFGQTSLDKIHLGQWDSHTQSALKNALGDYEGVVKSGTPMTWAEFLGNQAQAAVNAPGGYYSDQSKAKAKAPTAYAPIPVDNPDSIRVAAQNAAMDAMGQGLTEEQLNAFVTRFQQEQQKAGVAARTGHVGSGPAAGGTVVAPDLSGEAAAYAQQANPADFSSYQDDRYMNALMDMFLPSQSQRPNLGQITPRVSA